MKTTSSSVLILNVNKKKQSQVNFLKREVLRHFFAVGGLEHHALQVGTGIGFGQVHGHRLAGAHARNKARMVCGQPVRQRPGSCSP